MKTRNLKCDLLVIARMEAPCGMPPVSGVTPSIVAIFLAILTSCGTPQNGDGNVAYERQTARERMIYDIETSRSNQPFQSGSEPLAGWRTGTDGSGWFHNEEALKGLRTPPYE
jgi:hypothetical protein